MAITLLIGAFPPEVGLLAEELASSKSFRVAVGGIGSVACALGVELELARDDVSEVLFVGSAGVYPGYQAAPPPDPSPGLDRLRPGYALLGCLAVSADFSRHDLAVLWGHARLPGPMTHRVTTGAGPLGLLLRKEEDIIEGPTNSPDAVSLSLPENFRAEAAFENMEAFGAAVASLRRGVPFSAVFSLTNIVGPEGSTQWFRNHKDFGLALQERVLSLL